MVEKRGHIQPETERNPVKDPWSGGTGWVVALVIIIALGVVAYYLAFGDNDVALPPASNPTVTDAPATPPADQAPAPATGTTAPDGTTTGTAPAPDSAPAPEATPVPENAPATNTTQ